MVNIQQIYSLHTYIHTYIHTYTKYNLTMWLSFVKRKRIPLFFLILLQLLLLLLLDNIKYKKQIFSHTHQNV